MAKLRKGELIVNNIELSMTESLTSFLAKTISLPKIAKNINNYHHIFMNDVFFYDTKGYICFVFDEFGRLDYVLFSISKGYEENIEDKSKLLCFLK